MNYPHAIRLLELAAAGARSNEKHQESFGTHAEAIRQKRLCAEFRGAVAVLKMVDGERTESVSQRREERKGEKA